MNVTIMQGNVVLTSYVTSSNVRFGRYVEVNGVLYSMKGIDSTVTDGVMTHVVVHVS